MLAFKHLYAYSLTELLAVVFFVLLRCIHIMHSDSFSSCAKTFFPALYCRWNRPSSSLMQKALSPLKLERKVEKINYWTHLKRNKDALLNETSVTNFCSREIGNDQNCERAEWNRNRQQNSSYFLKSFNFFNDIDKNNRKVLSVYV